MYLEHLRQAMLEIYIGVFSNVIAYQRVTYIIGMTVIFIAKSVNLTPRKCINLVLTRSTFNSC